MRIRLQPTRVPLFLALAATLVFLRAASAAPGESDCFATRRPQSALSGVLLTRGGIPVAGAFVSEASSGAATTTAPNGRFVLSGLAPGAHVLTVSAGGANAIVRFSSSKGGRSRGVIFLGGTGAGGAAAVFLPVSGRGHEGTEIEGTVTANDGVSTLTIQDQRLGSVIVTTDSNTQIQKGNAPVALPSITVGMTVHAKASQQSDGTYLAGEVIVQDQNNSSGGTDSGGGGSENETEVSGTVKSFDCTAGTMVLTTDSGDVNITFDSNTVFMQKGQTVACSALAVGDDAEVSGTPQSDGSILAAKVSFEAPETEEVEVEGTVASVAAPNFVVTTESGAVTVDTDGSTQFFLDGNNPGSFTDIAVGVQVSADGTLQSDGSVLASKVHISTGGGD